MIQVFRTPATPGRAASRTASCAGLPDRPRPTPSVGVMRAREHRAEAARWSASSTRAGRRHRRQPRARTPSARRWSATSCSATSPARLRRQPGGRRGRRLPAYATVQDIPATSTSRSSPFRPTPCTTSCSTAPTRACTASSSSPRVRRDRRGGPAAAAPAGRARPLLRDAPDRPQLPRRHQHRPRGPAQRLAVAADAGPRPGRLLLPVGRPRDRRPRERRPPRARPVDVRLGRQPRRRVRQRPAAVLGGGRRHRRRAALPRVDRQPAQVLPIARRVGGASRWSRSSRAAPPRACRSGTPSARRRAAARSTRCSGRPASSRSTRSTRCSTSPSCWPTSRCRAGPGSRSSGTPTPSACSPPTPPRRPASSSTAGVAGRRRDRRRLRGRAGRRDRRPRGRLRRSRSTSRRSTPRARRSPACSPRWGSSPTSRSCRRSWAPRACPSCSGCPTSPGWRRARLGAVLPRLESAVRALAPVVGYAVWLAPPRHGGLLGGVDAPAARHS